MNQLRTSVTLRVQRRSISVVPSRPRNRSMMPLHLQELRLRVLLVVGTGQRALGARSQILLEIAHLGVGRGFGLQRDVAAGVVVDVDAASR